MKKQILPLLALRGKMVYPDTSVYFEVSRPKSMAALEQAVNHEQQIFLVNQIDPSIEEASTILGASSRQTFFKVTIPMIREAFLSGLIYSFARSMTLVSTVVFLISAKWKLLTPEIMNHIDQGRIGMAAAYCTILIVIVSVFMIIVRILMSFTNAKK